MDAADLGGNKQSSGLRRSQHFYLPPGTDSLPQSPTRAASVSLKIASPQLNCVPVISISFRGERAMFIVGHPEMESMIKENGAWCGCVGAAVDASLCMSVQKKKNHYRRKNKQIFKFSGWGWSLPHYSSAIFFFFGNKNPVCLAKPEINNAHCIMHATKINSWKPFKPFLLKLVIKEASFFFLKKMEVK